MRIRSLVTTQLLLLSLSGCSASGGGTQVSGGSPNVIGGNSANSTAAVGGQVTPGGSSAITSSTVATGGISASTGGSANTTGGQNAAANSNTGGSSAVGKTATGGSAPTGGESSNTGGTPSVGGTKAAGGSATSSGSSNKGGTSGVGGSLMAGGTSSSGGTDAAGAATTAGGSSSAGGTASSYYGFKPAPSSQNTNNFDAKAWYTQWLSNYYSDCTGTTTSQGRIANGQGSNNTVSEGIGYGMLMAVGNDDQAHFGKLWAYYKAHFDKNGLMNWSINACDSGDNGAFAATDADEDVAMALVQADAKWGGYKTDATTLITAIKTYETSSTTTPTYLRPGDAANNGGKGEGTVNPSYFATGYWHVWATYVNDPYWNQLATDAYTMLASWQALSINDAANVATTGLVPDWGMAAGTNPNNNKYWYDACRTPWRVAVDYVWFGNTQSQTFLKNVCTYIDKKGFSSIISSYNSNGAGNSAFFGAFAVAGMAVSQTTADSYVNAWLSAQMDDTPYFQGALRGVYLLLANQNFPKGI